ncbi:SulP family inorganic anion transporter [Marinomonas sp. RS-M-Aa-14]|uniref:SulP family inorganic anion transporter n=1 Tax=Marinomonas sp. RS-M-Aa-14 TaxID=3241169 RepID=UPI00390C8D27
MLNAIISTLFPFLIWAKKQTPETVKKDLIAGITGAVLVLPQGVAYAYIAGLPPEIGLYTAIVSASVAALFGSSFHMISGPTAALSIVVASIVHQIGYSSTTEQMLIVVTLSFLTGLIQFLLGALRLGALVNFISHTVIVGFTTGAALLIATSQIKHLLGIEVASRLSFIQEIGAILKHVEEVNFYALIIGIATLATSIAIKLINKRLPNLLIGMIIGSVICFFANGQNYGVVMVESMSGTLPSFSLPDLSSSRISSLFSGAFAVALLGLIEAVSIARAISVRSKQIIDGNQEFIGQGMSNLIGGFFSCYPSSGSFTRSGANFDAGAVSPFSAVYAAIIVALIIAFIPSATSYLPLPAMAGSVLLIAWNLINIKDIIEILKISYAEATILIGTFFSTLFIQLEFAIYVGIILSIGFYLRRTSRPKIIEVAPIQDIQNRIIRNIHRYSLDVCPQIKIIRIDGSLYFGSVDYVQKELGKIIQNNTKHLIIVAKGINFMDASGVHFLESEVYRIEKLGCNVKICSLKGTVLDEIKSMPIYNSFLVRYLTNNTKDAISELLRHINQERCSQCSARIFNECVNFPANGVHEKKENDIG